MIEREDQKSVLRKYLREPSRKSREKKLRQWGLHT
jgi:hypothetical protein